MDTETLLLLVAIESPWIGFAVFALMIRRKLRTIRMDALKAVANALFIDTVVDGKSMKTPNPELIAMAGSYVDALIPVFLPKVISWASKNIKFGTGGAGGALDLQNFDPAQLGGMLPKKYQKFAPLLGLLKGPLQKMLGNGGETAAEKTTGLAANPFLK